MKNTITIFALLLCLQICKAQSALDNDGYLQPKKIILFMPSFGGGSMQVNNDGMTKALASKGYNKYENKIDISAFALQAYYSKHWRTEFNLKIGSTDTNHYNDIDLFSANRTATISIGYSIRKNKIMEDWNIVPNIGVYANRDKIKSNDVAYNNYSKEVTFTDKETFTNSSIGVMGSVKIEKGLPKFSMLTLLKIGAEFGAMHSLSNSTIKINNADNTTTYLPTSSNTTNLFWNFSIKMDMPILGTDIY
jgi:hypothetical protein